MFGLIMMMTAEMVIMMNTGKIMMTVVVVTGMIMVRIKMMLMIPGINLVIISVMTDNTDRNVNQKYFTFGKF